MDVARFLLGSLGTCLLLGLLIAGGVSENSWSDRQFFEMGLEAAGVLFALFLVIAGPMLWGDFRMRRQ